MTKQISPEVLALLDMAIVDGNTVRPLPMAEREVYEELNEIFVRLRGQWKRNKGHVFPYDPTAAVEAIRLSGVMPDKNPLAYFPTPRELAEFIANESDEPFGGATTMLEPSAGWGSMIEAARKRWPDIKVTAVELDALNAATLIAKGVEVIEADFLAHDFGDARFDIILMNPPFSTKADRNVWVAHLRKAFDLLAPDGELSCIVPSGMWQGSSLRLFVELRDWLLLHGATIEAHEHGAFKESGTGVKTATIKMSRPTPRRPQDIEHESNTFLQTGYGARGIADNRDGLRRTVAELAVAATMPRTPEPEFENALLQREVELGPQLFSLPRDLDQLRAQLVEQRQAAHDRADELTAEWRGEVARMRPLLAEVTREREQLRAQLDNALRERDVTQHEADRLRFRVEVDESDLDEAGFFDDDGVGLTDPHPKILAWMAANRFEFHEAEGQDGRPCGIWLGAMFVRPGAPMADEGVVNDLALAVNRQPLDVLAEIAAMVIE
jgi:predicted RNA methylase